VAPVTAGDVRQYLSEVERGSIPQGSPELRQLIEGQRAVTLPPAPPGLTDIGRHVLSELGVRSDRTDPLPVDQVAGELSSVALELDAVAKSAEYFLAELGALTPAEAAPFLRVVAAGLANRRETPEELAERFRNVWGMVEVMGGDARDRLLAAELLAASPEVATRVYPNIVQTSNRLREEYGASKSTVGLSAILHLLPSPTPEAPVAEWMRHREEVAAEEASAWVAGLVQRDAGAWDRFRAFRARLLEPDPKARGSALAAAQLTELGPAGARTLEKVPALARALGDEFPLPLLSAALLLARQPLSAGELLDWLHKAQRIAEQRQLAPTPAEIAVLAVALVHGLPPHRWAGRTSAEAGGMPISTLLVLHAGLYRSVFASRPSAVPAR
jgi:hypothetical protein